MPHRSISVRAMTPERAAALRAQPAPAPEQPTTYAGKTDQQILDLNLELGLTKDQSRALEAEMSRRGLYGN